MLIAAIGDIHGPSKRLDRIIKELHNFNIDIILQAGDIGPNHLYGNYSSKDLLKYQNGTRQVLNKIGELNKPVFWVPGNHDTMVPFFVPNDNIVISPQHNNQNIDNQIQIYEGLNILGTGGAGPAQFGFPYEWTESIVERRLEAAHGTNINIWLCHCPPYNTSLDITKYDGSVGSKAIKEYIKILQPELFLCGHIHESDGIELIGKTICINLGSLGDPYPQTIAWLIEWDKGPGNISRLTIKNDMLKIDDIMEI